MYVIGGNKCAKNIRLIYHKLKKFKKGDIKMDKKVIEKLLEEKRNEYSIESKRSKEVLEKMSTILTDELKSKIAYEFKIIRIKRSILFGKLCELVIAKDNFFEKCIEIRSQWTVESEVLNQIHSIIWALETQLKNAENDEKENEFEKIFKEGTFIYVNNNQHGNGEWKIFAQIKKIKNKTYTFSRVFKSEDEEGFRHSAYDENEKIIRLKSFVTNHGNIKLSKELSETIK